MDLASALARDGAAAGTVVVADHQTLGRGQRGRVWREPAGTCLLVTVLLRPSLAIAMRPDLPRLVAKKISEAVTSVSGLKPTIKHPNDVLLNGRKVCGILCQSSIRGDMLEYLLIGIGLNVNVQPGDLPFETATSLLAETGEVHDRDHLLDVILERLTTLSGLCDTVPLLT